MPGSGSLKTRLNGMQSHGSTCATLPADKSDNYTLHHMVDHNQIIYMDGNHNHMATTRLPVIVTR